MKPTKEIIELSKKLHELGYRKEKIDVGDWYYNPDHPHRKLYVYDSYLSSEKQKKEFLLHLPFIIPIPSLEDGLEWLEAEYSQKQEKVFSLVYLDTERGGRWRVCLIADDFGTAHEAVLKAMIKVMESK